jgi:hypothetical protein
VPFTIVGVTEPTFTSLTPGKTQDMFLSLSMLPRLNIDWANYNARALNNWWLTVVARLKPGVSVRQAQAETSLNFRNLMLYGEIPLSKVSDDPAIVLVPALTSPGCRLLARRLGRKRWLFVWHWEAVVEESLGNY